MVMITMYRYGDRTVTWRGATCEGVVPGGGVARLGGVALARRHYTRAGATRARGKPGSVAAAGAAMLKARVSVIGLEFGPYSCWA
ncbi:hypothetical protein ES332_D01G167300v1 [Gossypium tomentosum]|uniref:Uncharacterized protein n=1 Tax=Gossypium tomentosum TaxID=34277 RepID=A0A5D2MA90_GOSTO|nr:hypothetical protein ES332_D01G167300v1 [Gossypium tomentosum]